MKRRCSFLRPVIPLRPGFREFYHISTFNNPLNGSVVIYPRRKISYPEPLARIYTDRMEYCLGSILWECGCKVAEMHGKEHDRPFDMSLGFAMLDEHMGVCEKIGNKKELARLDGNLYSLITDLSAVQQMHGMLQILRPRPIEANLQDLMQNCEGRGWRYLCKHFLEEASYRYCNFDMENNTFTNIECPEQSEPMDDQDDAEFFLGKLLEAFLNAPQPTSPRNTQARLEAEDTQRASLHRFWAGIKERHAHICRRIRITKDDIDSDLKILSFDNDPDYLEAIKIEREQILHAIAAKEAAKISRKNKRHTT